MKRSLSPLKVIAASLSFIFLFDNCLFAYKPQTTLWSERRKVVQLASLPPAALPIAAPRVFDALPAVAANVPLRFKSRLLPIVQALSNNYGTVRKISMPSAKDSGKTIVHIQDVHMNREAQQNIGHALQALMNEKQVGLIALEGAFSPIDLASFRSFPHQPAVRNAADYLLSENKISGPLHAALASPVELPSIVGIDDAAHYQANVDAYRRSVSLVKREKEGLAKREAVLSGRKLKSFNPDLAAFDARVTTYHSGAVKMGDYVGLLAAHAAPTAAARAFLDASKLEASLDFARVETERSRLLSTLLPRLDKNKSADLMAMSAAFRSGQISHGEFYRALQTVCDRNGVRLAEFPAMGDYLRYVAVSESIDAEKLFEDLKTMEGSAYASLATTAGEKRLLAESRLLYLTGKLLDFSLTNQEWQEYRRGGPLCPPESAETVSSGRHGGRPLQPFEDFYREAEIRDQKMAENVLARVPTTGVSVLVTGGFHSTGISKRLREAGYTVVSFVPKITKVESENGSAYLSVFTQEKTPLEKLFEGEKLFLAKRQFTRSDVILWGLLIAGAAAIANGLPASEISTWLEALLHWSHVAVFVTATGAAHITGQFLTANGGWAPLDVSVSPELGVTVNVAAATGGMLWSLFLKSGGIFLSFILIGMAASHDKSVKAELTDAQILDAIHDLGHYSSAEHAFDRLLGVKERALPLLIESLSHRLLDARLGVIRVLGQMRASQSVEPLFAVFGQSNERLASLAAHALLQFPDPDSVIENKLIAKIVGEKYSGKAAYRPHIVDAEKLLGDLSFKNIESSRFLSVVTLALFYALLEHDPAAADELMREIHGSFEWYLALARLPEEKRSADDVEKVWKTVINEGNQLMQGDEKRIAAGWTLSQINSTRGAASLAKLLIDYNSSVAGMAKQKLSAMGSSAVPALGESLFSPKNYSPERTLDVLISIGNDDAVRLVLDALNKGSIQLAGQAATALLQLPDSSLVERRLGADFQRILRGFVLLRDIRKGERFSNLQKEFFALKEAALPALRAAAFSSHLETVAFALNLLTDMKLPAAEELFNKRLNEHAERLAGLAREERSDWVRTMEVILKSIQRKKLPSARVSLENFLLKLFHSQLDSYDVRALAREALNRIEWVGDKRSLPVLFAAAATENREVKEIGGRQLAQWLGRSHAVYVALGLIENHPNEDIRMSAVKFLENSDWDLSIFPPTFTRAPDVPQEFYPSERFLRIVIGAAVRIKNEDHERWLKEKDKDKSGSGAIFNAYLHTVANEGVYKFPQRFDLLETFDEFWSVYKWNIGLFFNVASQSFIPNREKSYDFTDPAENFFPVYFKNPRLRRPYLDAAFADALVIYGSSLGSNIEEVLSEAADPEVNLLTQPEKTRVLLMWSSGKINAASGLPRGHLGSVQYNTLGYENPKHGLPAVTIKWSDENGKYSSNPPPLTSGFHRASIEDGNRNSNAFLGYLGRLAAASDPLGIHDASDSAGNLRHSKAEGFEVYKIGEQRYKRPVKRVRRDDGSIFHVAPIGLDAGLSLAYYKILENGAVFTACINASRLRDSVAQEKKQAGELGYLNLAESSSKVATFLATLKLELNQLLRDQPSAPSAEKIERATKYMKLEFPSSFKGTKDFEEAWQRLVANNPQAAEEIDRRFQLNFLFYELPFSHENLSHDQLVAVARHTNEKASRELGESLFSESFDVDRASGNELTQLLTESFSRYRQHALLLKDLARLFSYNATEWAMMALESMTVGQVPGESAVQHYPVYQEIERQTVTHAQVNHSPYVWVSLPAEISDQLGFQGRRTLLSEGANVKDVLALVGISADRVRVTKNGVEMNADSPLEDRDTIKIDATRDVAGAIGFRINLWIANALGPWAVGAFEHTVGFSIYFGLGILVGLGSYFIYGPWLFGSLQPEFVMFWSLVGFTFTFIPVSRVVLWALHYRYGVIERVRPEDGALPGENFRVTKSDDDLASAASLVAWVTLSVSVFLTMVGADLVIFSPDDFVFVLVLILPPAFLIGLLAHAYQNTGYKEGAPLFATLFVAHVVALIVALVLLVFPEMAAIDWSLVIKYTVSGVFGAAFLMTSGKRADSFLRVLSRNYWATDLSKIDEGKRISWSEKAWSRSEAAYDREGPKFVQNKSTFVADMEEKALKLVGSGVDMISHVLLQLKILPVLKIIGSWFSTVYFEYYLDSVSNTKMSRDRVVEKFKAHLRGALSREDKRRVMRSYFFWHRGGYVWADSAMENFNEPGYESDVSAYNYMGKNERLIEPLCDFLYSMVKLKGNVKDPRDVKIIRFLQDRLLDPDQRVVNAALRGLMLVTPYMDEKTKKGFNDDSFRLSILNAITLAIKQQKNPEAVAALARSLGHSNHIAVFRKIREVWMHPNVSDSDYSDAAKTSLLEAMERLFVEFPDNQKGYLGEYFSWTANFLLEQAEDRKADLFVRVRALKALGQMRGIPVECLARVTRLLRTDANTSIQSVALWALVRLTFVDASRGAVDDLARFLMEFVKDAHYAGSGKYERNERLVEFSLDILGTLDRFAGDPALAARIDAFLVKETKSALWSPAGFALVTNEKPLVFLYVPGAQNDVVLGAGEKRVEVHRRLLSLREDLENRGNTVIATGEYREKRSMAQPDPENPRFLDIKLQDGTMARVIDQLVLGQPARVQRRDGTRGSHLAGAGYDEVSRDRIVIIGSDPKEREQLEKALGRPIPMIDVSGYLETGSIKDSDLSVQQFDRLANDIKEAAEAFLHPPIETRLMNQSRRFKAMAVQMRTNLSPVISSVLIFIGGFCFILSNWPALYWRVSRFVNPYRMSVAHLFALMVYRWTVDVKRRVKAQFQSGPREVTGHSSFSSSGVNDMVRAQEARHAWMARSLGMKITDSGDTFVKTEAKNVWQAVLFLLADPVPNLTWGVLFLSPALALLGAWSFHAPPFVFVPLAFISALAIKPASRFLYYATVRSFEDWIAFLSYVPRLLLPPFWAFGEEHFLVGNSSRRKSKGATEILASEVFGVNDNPVLGAHKLTDTPPVIGELWEKPSHLSIDYLHEGRMRFFNLITRLFADKILFRLKWGIQDGADLKDALEIGAGGGALLEYAMPGLKRLYPGQKIPSWLQTDRARIYLDRASTALRRTMVVNVLQPLPFADGSQKAILSLSAMDTLLVENFPRVFAEFKRVIAPGQSLIFVSDVMPQPEVQQKAARDNGMEFFMMDSGTPGVGGMGGYLVLDWNELIKQYPQAATDPLVLLANEFRFNMARYGFQASVDPLKTQELIKMGHHLHELALRYHVRFALGADAAQLHFQQLRVAAEQSGFTVLYAGEVRAQYAEERAVLSHIPPQANSVRFKSGMVGYHVIPGLKELYPEIKDPIFVDVGIDLFHAVNGTPSVELLDYIKSHANVDETPAPEYIGSYDGQRGLEAFLKINYVRFRDSLPLSAQSVFTPDILGEWFLSARSGDAAFSSRIEAFRNEVASVLSVSQAPQLEAALQNISNVVWAYLSLGNPIGASHSGTPVWDEIAEMPYFMLFILVGVTAAHVVPNLVGVNYFSVLFVFNILLTAGTVEMTRSAAMRRWFLLIHDTWPETSPAAKAVRMAMGSALVFAWGAYVLQSGWSPFVVFGGLFIVTALGIVVRMIRFQWGRTEPAKNRQASLENFHRHLHAFTFFVFQAALISLLLIGAFYGSAADWETPAFWRKLFATASLDAFVVWTLGANFFNHFSQNMILRIFGPQPWMPHLASATATGSRPVVFDTNQGQIPPERTPVLWADAGNAGELGVKNVLTWPVSKRIAVIGSAVDVRAWVGNTVAQFEAPERKNLVRFFDPEMADVIGATFAAQLREFAPDIVLYADGEVSTPVERRIKQIVHQVAAGKMALGYGAAVRQAGNYSYVYGEEQAGIVDAAIRAFGSQVYRIDYPGLALHRDRTSALVDPESELPYSTSLNVFQWRNGRLVRSTAPRRIENGLFAFFGAHPDDVPIAVGSLLVGERDRNGVHSYTMTASDRDIIYDKVTGKRLTPDQVRETRQKEDIEAHKILGVPFECLALPFYNRKDGAGDHVIGDDDIDPVVDRMTRLIEQQRWKSPHAPALFFVHDPEDLHPAHRATTRIIIAAVERVARKIGVSPYVVFYKSPWSQDLSKAYAHFYYRNNPVLHGAADHANSKNAIPGRELLGAGFGQVPPTYEQLGGDKAELLTVSRFPGEARRDGAAVFSKTPQLILLFLMVLLIVPFVSWSHLWPLMLVCAPFAILTRKMADTGDGAPKPVIKADVEIEFKPKLMNVSMVSPLYLKLTVLKMKVEDRGNVFRFYPGPDFQWPDAKPKIQVALREYLGTLKQEWDVFMESTNTGLRIVLTKKEAPSPVDAPAPAASVVKTEIPRPVAASRESIANLKNYASAWKSFRKLVDRLMAQLDGKSLTDKTVLSRGLSLLINGAATIPEQDPEKVKVLAALKEFTPDTLAKIDELFADMVLKKKGAEAFFQRWAEKVEKAGSATLNSINEIERRNAAPQPPPAAMLLLAVPEPTGILQIVLIGLFVAFMLAPYFRRMVEGRGDFGSNVRKVGQKFTYESSKGWDIAQEIFSNNYLSWSHRSLTLRFSPNLSTKDFERFLRFTRAARNLRLEIDVDRDHSVTVSFSDGFSQFEAYRQLLAELFDYFLWNETRRRAADFEIVEKGVSVLLRDVSEKIAPTPADNSRMSDDATLDRITKTRTQLKLITDRAQHWINFSAFVMSLLGQNINDRYFFKRYLQSLIDSVNQLGGASIFMVDGAEKGSMTAAVSGISKDVVEAIDRQFAAAPKRRNKALPADLQHSVSLIVAAGATVNSAVKKTIQRLDAEELALRKKAATADPKSGPAPLTRFATRNVARALGIEKFDPSGYTTEVYFSPLWELFAKFGKGFAAGHEWRSIEQETVGVPRIFKYAWIGLAVGAVLFALMSVSFSNLHYSWLPIAGWFVGGVAGQSSYNRQAWWMRRKGADGWAPLTIGTAMNPKDVFVRSFNPRAVPPSAAEYVFSHLPPKVASVEDVRKLLVEWKSKGGSVLIGRNQFFGQAADVAAKWNALLETYGDALEDDGIGELASKGSAVFQSIISDESQAAEPRPDPAATTRIQKFLDIENQYAPVTEPVKESVLFVGAARGDSELILRAVLKFSEVHIVDIDGHKLRTQMRPKLIADLNALGFDRDAVRKFMARVKWHVFDFSGELADYSMAIEKAVKEVKNESNPDGDRYRPLFQALEDLPASPWPMTLSLNKTFDRIVFLKRHKPMAQLFWTVLQNEMDAAVPGVLGDKADLSALGLQLDSSVYLRIGYGLSDTIGNNLRRLSAQNGRVLYIEEADNVKEETVVSMFFEAAFDLAASDQWSWNKTSDAVQAVEAFEFARKKTHSLGSKLLELLEANESTRAVFSGLLSLELASLLIEAAENKASTLENLVGSVIRSERVIERLRSYKVPVAAALSVLLQAIEVTTRRPSLSVFDLKVPFIDMLADKLTLRAVFSGDVAVDPDVNKLEGATDTLERWGAYTHFTNSYFSVSRWQSFSAASGYLIRKHLYGIENVPEDVDFIPVIDRKLVPEEVKLASEADTKQALLALHRKYEHKPDPRSVLYWGGPFEVSGSFIETLLIFEHVHIVDFAEKHITTVVLPDVRHQLRSLGLRNNQINRVMSRVHLHMGDHTGKLLAFAKDARNTVSAARERGKSVDQTVDDLRALVQQLPTTRWNYPLEGRYDFVIATLSMRDFMQGVMGICEVELEKFFPPEAFTIDQEKNKEKIVGALKGLATAMVDALEDKFERLLKYDGRAMWIDMEEWGDFTVNSDGFETLTRAGTAPSLAEGQSTFKGKKIKTVRWMVREPKDGHPGNYFDLQMNLFHKKISKDSVRLIEKLGACADLGRLIPYIDYRITRVWLRLYEQDLRTGRHAFQQNVSLFLSQPEVAGIFDHMRIDPEQAASLIRQATQIVVDMDRGGADKPLVTPARTAVRQETAVLNGAAAVALPRRIPNLSSRPARPRSELPAPSVVAPTQKKEPAVEPESVKPTAPPLPPLPEKPFVFETGPSVIHAQFDGDVPVAAPRMSIMSLLREILEWLGEELPEAPVLKLIRPFETLMENHSLGERSVDFGDALLRCIVDVETFTFSELHLKPLQGATLAIQELDDRLSASSQMTVADIEILSTSLLEKLSDESLQQESKKYSEPVQTVLSEDLSVIEENLRAKSMSLGVAEMDGAYKIVEIGDRADVEALVVPLLTWLSKDGSKNRNAVLYVAPSHIRSESIIAKEISRVLGEHGGVAAWKDRMVVLPHSGLGGDYSADRIIAAAFNPDFKNSLFGVPQTALAPRNWSVLVLRTVNGRSWLAPAGVDVGGVRILPSQIVAMFIDLLEGSATKIDWKAKVLGGQSARRAA